jgi:hypothetical protein
MLQPDPRATRRKQEGGGQGLEPELRPSDAADDDIFARSSLSSDPLETHFVLW